MLRHTLALVGTTVDKGELIQHLQTLLIHWPQSKAHGARQHESEGSNYQDAILCTQEILLSAQGSSGSRVNNIVQFGGAGVLKVQHIATFKTILRRCFALPVAFALASSTVTTFRLLRNETPASSTASLWHCMRV